MVVDDCKLFSVRDVAVRFGLSVETVRRRIKDGEIPSIRIGGARRIPADQLRETIARKAGESVAESAMVAE